MSLAGQPPQAEFGRGDVEQEIEQLLERGGGDIDAWSRRDEPVPTARACARDFIVLQLDDRNAGDDPEGQSRCDVTRRCGRGRADRLWAVEATALLKAPAPSAARRPSVSMVSRTPVLRCPNSTTSAARFSFSKSRPWVARPICRRRAISSVRVALSCSTRHIGFSFYRRRPISLLGPASGRPPILGARTPQGIARGRHDANRLTDSPEAMPTTADRERLLRELAAANVAVGSEASLEDVLQKTAEVAARLVNARYAALGVLDRTGSHLERLITVGIDEATRARIGDLPSDHGVLRVLLREARPVRVADVTTEQHFFGFPPAHPQMRSFLGVPIFVRGVVYGDLYLAEKEGGEFTEADEEIVTLLAAQTGLTIEKVQIHEGATTGFGSSRCSTI